MSAETRAPNLSTQPFPLCPHFLTVPEAALRRRPAIGRRCATACGSEAAVRRAADGGGGRGPGDGEAAGPDAVRRAPGPPCRQSIPSGWPPCLVPGAPSSLVQKHGGVVQAAVQGDTTHVITCLSKSALQTLYGLDHLAVGCSLPGFNLFRLFVSKSNMPGR